MRKEDIDLVRLALSVYHTRTVYPGCVEAFERIIQEKEMEKPMLNTINTGKYSVVPSVFYYKEQEMPTPMTIELNRPTVAQHSETFANTETVVGENPTSGANCKNKSTLDVKWHYDVRSYELAIVKDDHLRTGILYINDICGTQEEKEAIGKHIVDLHNTFIQTPMTIEMEADGRRAALNALEELNDEVMAVTEYTLENTRFEDLILTIRAALQSPRVPEDYFFIPKLPDGWEIFCLGRYREDGKHGYWLETRNTASGYLCRECNIPIAYGETIEDVFNKMKNKILDSRELTRRITEGGLI